MVLRVMLCFQSKPGKYKPRSCQDRPCWKLRGMVSTFSTCMLSAILTRLVVIANDVEGRGFVTGKLHVARGHLQTFVFY